ncbi:hypothetical protein VspSTUT11_21220 [Vibrio sp. STUT-A11]|nr:hypothetical protein VspSTUT11_21220 [Vibrio sp. STUT-A11]
MGEIYPRQMIKWVDLDTPVNQQIKMATIWLPFKIYELLSCLTPALMKLDALLGCRIKENRL